MKKIIVYCLLFLFSTFGFSQYQRLSDNAKISVLTCGSGSELYSIYGHTAIRIRDTNTNLDVVYNYGTFDFSTENFYFKFIKGDLQYFISSSSFNDFMTEYIYEKREVKEQELVLSTQNKQELFDELTTSLFSDSKFYTYKFIEKNCTIMVLDKVNGIFGKTLIFKNNKELTSYRSVLYPYLKDHFFENLGINIMFGHKTDLAAERLFLPIELLQGLNNARFDNKPIAKPIFILNPKRANESSFVWWNSIYFFYFISLSLIFITSMRFKMIYLSVIGILGIFLIWVGFYSLHHEVTQNYNILLFNPILILLNICYYFRLKKISIVLIFLNSICIFCYLVLLINKPHFMMMLPFIIISSYYLKCFLPKKKLLTSVE